MTTRQELRADLIAWANGDLTKTAPSSFDSPEANDLLWEAVLFELGRYDCSDAAQRETAIEAIDEFAASTAIDDFVDV
jgi:hypothetical protein